MDWREVQLERKDRGLSMVREAGDAIVAEGPSTMTMGGGQMHYDRWGSPDSS
jgi:hypothetical protein